MSMDPSLNFIKDYLFHLASLHNVEITDCIDLQPSTPDLSIITYRGIFMNINLNTNVSYCFRLAHELSHILYGDSDNQKVYAFSEYGKRSEEHLAHKNAIKLLMSIEEPTSPNSFMEIYHVPFWLLGDVEREFKNITNN